MKRTISFVRGKGDLQHNNRQRNPLPRNVDPLRMKDNIYLIQEPLEVAYEKCFGKAIEEFNKGKKPCRQKTVGDYMEQIKQNQNNRNQPKLFYEWVVQIGDMIDSGHGNNEAGFKACTEVLKEYMEDFQRRNPGIYVFNMALHLDERTPHLHIDGIFVGKGFKNGMQTRNSQTKAFENMGFKTKGNREDNGLKAWQQQEREELSKIARAHGIETTLQNAGKRKQLSVNEYKAIVQYADREAERTADRVLQERGFLDKLAGKVTEKDYKQILLAYRGKCNELKREQTARAEEREGLLSLDAVQEKQNADQLRDELKKTQKALQEQARDFSLLSEAFRKLSAYVPFKERERAYDIARGIKGASVSMPANYNQNAGKKKDFSRDRGRE